MGRSDNWAYIQTPKQLFEQMEKILESEEFHNFGYFKPKDINIVLIREWLKNPKSILNDDSSKITFIDTIDDKIILNDSQQGTVIVQIDEKNKLQCYFDDEDSHDNKYVRFCLKNKDLWDFLKERNVKLVQPRTVDKDKG